VGGRRGLRGQKAAAKGYDGAALRVSSLKVFPSCCLYRVP